MTRLLLLMAEIVHNSKARRDYQVLDTFEAGLVLHGSEVKTLRAGKAQINDAFARVEKQEVWLYNAHIDEYDQANRFGHQPTAPRKLLLHKSEIRKLFGWPPSRAMPSFRSPFIGKTARSKSPWPSARAKWSSTSGRTSKSATSTAN